MYIGGEDAYKLRLCFAKNSPLQRTAVIISTILFNVHKVYILPHSLLMSFVCFSEILPFISLGLTMEQETRSSRGMNEIRI